MRIFLFSGLAISVAVGSRVYFFKHGIPGTYSGNSLYYGIRGRMEAIQYICHPLLRQRLIDIVEAILQTGEPIYQIFPAVDARKVISCLELFSSVSDIQAFKVLKKQLHIR